MPNNINLFPAVMPFFTDSPRPKRVLVVDDMPTNVHLMKKYLTAYEFESAGCGSEALAKVAANPPDLILLDVVMPDMNGFEVCAALKTNPQFQHIPVIIISALEDKASRIKGLQAGANEFLSKPFDPAEFSLRVSNQLQLKEYSDMLRSYNALLLTRLEERTQELEASYHETIRRLTISAEFKDNDTGNHIKRIGYYTRHLAQQLSYPHLGTLELASQMHDIGKIGIPDHLLFKPGPLTADEFEVMKTHTLIGGKILDNSISLVMQTAKIVALSHHERWDGTGYPFGLAEEEIPVEGRIVALADQYDALRMARSYKPAFTHEETCKIILAGDGRTKPKHFWPLALEIFRDIHQTFNQCFEEHGN